MTRRLLTLFTPGLLMSQDPDFHGYPMGRAKRQRSANGQCPVCGTMAEPYVVPIGPYSWQIESRRIDCARCNATFRQWAEGKEPKR